MGLQVSKGAWIGDKERGEIARTWVDHRELYGNHSCLCGEE